MNQSVPTYYMILAMVAMLFLYWAFQAIKSARRRMREISAGLTANAAALGSLTKSLAEVMPHIAKVHELSVQFSSVTVKAESLEKHILAAMAKAETIQKTLAEVGLHITSIPKLMEGIARIGAAQADLMKTQDLRQKNPFGKPNEPILNRDVTAANQEYEISQAMRTLGITREEAMLRLNPANDRSVFGSFFEDWDVRQAQ